MTKTNLNSLARILEEYPIKQFPAMGQMIVNKMAFESRKQAVQRVKKQFINRNTFTVRNIQFVKSPKTRSLLDIESSYGATDKASYMAEQEEGLTLRSKSGGSLAIPTGAARRGESIRKLKQAKFKMNRISNVRRINEMKGRTKKQRTIALIQDMVRKKRNNRLAVLPFPNRPGIYQVKQDGDNPRGSKTRFKFRLKMIYDLSKKSVRIKPSPWMAPVNDGIFKHQGRIVEAAFQRFIK